MMQKSDHMAANWNCPSIEYGRNTAVPDQKMLLAYTNPGYVKKIAEENALQSEQIGSPRFVLPVWQNLESVALGTKLLKQRTGINRFLTPGEYCVKTLKELENGDMEFLSEPLMQAVLDSIPLFAGKDLILEAEAPFSILAALINPIDLFACFEDDGELLIEILYKIADASAEYIKACVDAGCRIISLADPSGTLDLTGEDYYKRFCGKAVIYLMRKCQPCLKHAVMHICRKMSLSLAAAGLAKAEAYTESGKCETYIDILKGMAENPKVYFTGLTCIHDRKPDLRKSYIIRID